MSSAPECGGECLRRNGLHSSGSRRFGSPYIRRHSSRPAIAAVRRLRHDSPDRNIPAMQRRATAYSVQHRAARSAQAHGTDKRCASVAPPCGAPSAACAEVWVVRCALQDGSVGRRGWRTGDRVGTGRRYHRGTQPRISIPLCAQTETAAQRAGSDVAPSTATRHRSARSTTSAASNERT